MSDDDAMNEGPVEQQQTPDETKETDISTPSTNNTTITNHNDNNDNDNDTNNHVHPSSTTYLVIGDAFADLEPDATLQQIAATDRLPAPWSELKQTIQAAILKQCEIMHPKATDPAVQHNIETIRTNILHNLDRHSSAPFSIQRLCELVVDPRKHYQMFVKYLNAIEKVLLVTSTWDDFPDDARYPPNTVETMENVVFFAGQEQMSGVELEPITFEGEQSSHEHQQELQALMLGYNQSEEQQQQQQEENSPSSSAESRTSDASVEADIDEKEEEKKEIDKESSEKQEEQQQQSPPSAEKEKEEEQENGEKTKEEVDTNKKRKVETEETIMNTTDEVEPSPSPTLAVNPSDPPGASDAMEVDE
ncbi:PPP4R2-domain-containing protein [Syncephalastrum racemosum]|uniref:PPP4R2-domain-containing protein n=1 Tax=Syncephalastrum racemosum TaxID=13706 RepID=A0A1X2H8J6_SYNRA|nr:PPP4R2-domain-containing protein [Syncephalastrum racemosum]